MKNKQSLNEGNEGGIDVLFKTKILVLHGNSTDWVYRLFNEGGEEFFLKNLDSSW